MNKSSVDTQLEWRVINLLSKAMASEMEISAARAVFLLTKYLDTELPKSQLGLLKFLDVPTQMFGISEKSPRFQNYQSARKHLWENVIPRLAQEIGVFHV